MKLFFITNHVFKGDPQIRKHIYTNIKTCHLRTYISVFLISQRRLHCVWWMTNPGNPVLWHSHWVVTGLIFMSLVQEEVV